MNLRDQVAAANQQRQRKREPVTLAGVAMEAQGLTAGQVHHIQDTCFTKDAKPRPIMSKYYPALLIAGLVEPGTNNRVFKAEDVPLIESLDNEEQERVAEVINRLSGLGEKGEQEAKGNSASPAAA